MSREGPPSGGFPDGYYVAFGRLGVPGEPHAIVYKKGSQKSEHVTLCGIERSRLQHFAPFELGDHRNAWLWKVMCRTCSQRFDDLY